MASATAQSDFVALAQGVPGTQFGAKTLAL